jgi:hypothetical protein
VSPVSFRWRHCGAGRGCGDKRPGEFVEGAGIVGGALGPFPRRCGALVGRGAEGGASVVFGSQMRRAGIAQATALDPGFHSAAPGRRRG